MITDMGFAMSRIDKVAQQLKREISQVLLLEINDPRLGFLTITQVKVSPDLKIARVYFTTLGAEGEKGEAQKALGKASRYVRRRIAQRMRLKFIPEIKFFFDEELDRRLKVERLLDQLKDESPAGNQEED